VSQLVLSLRRYLPATNGQGALWLGFYAVILLAWAGVVMMARQVPGADLSSVPAEFWAALCLSAADADPVALWAMWALMVSAMMLPTIAPALRTFIDLSATGATDRKGAVALVLGYVGVWLVASVLGAFAQWGLARAGMIGPAGQSLSPWLTASLLIGAGAYQFSALKDRCLSKCRMPITFFMERWRPGSGAALRMGAELGVICLGCCWALMALGFIGGMMNLFWMGAATAFMALEKLPDIGRYLTRPAGAVLVTAGGVLLLRTIATI